MAQSAKPHVFTLVILAVAHFAGHASAQTPPVRVGVRLVNPVAVDSATLDNATGLVNRLFAEGGVELIWAGKPSGALAPELQLTVFLTAYPFVNTTPGSHDFGSAPIPDVGAGRIAYVRWDLVRSFARAEGVPPSLILGTVLTHEIGHLLLGRDSHSAEGIMRARWRGRDFYPVLRGQSGFSHDESERMRDQIAREPLLSARRRDPVPSQ